MNQADTLILEGIRRDEFRRSNSVADPRGIESMANAIKGLGSDVAREAVEELIKATAGVLETGGWSKEELEEMLLGVPTRLTI